MARQTRVYSINNVQLSLLKSNPPQLMVTAVGFTAQAGWSDVRLEPLEGELSADGILDLAFVGTPPGGISLPVLTPVIAHHVWEDAERVVGVTVHARSNTMSRLLDQGGMTTLALGEEGPPITEMVGEDAAPAGAVAFADKFTKTLHNGEEHGTVGKIGDHVRTTVPLSEEVPPNLFPFTTNPGLEEHPPKVPDWEIPASPFAGLTTMIHGEEHGPTTMIAGEEGSHAVGESTTFFPGEHGHSLPIAENASNYWAEHPTFVSEDRKPQPQPWFDPGPIGAFGTR